MSFGLNSIFVDDNEKTGRLATMAVSSSNRYLEPECLANKSISTIQQA